MIVVWSLCANKEGKQKFSAGFSVYKFYGSGFQNSECSKVQMKDLYSVIFCDGCG